MFARVVNPVQFWVVVRDEGITVKEIAKNLHKLRDSETIIDWILDSNSDYYIRKLFPKDIRPLLFNYCVKLGYHREVRYLLRGVNPAAYHNLALRQAVEQNDLEMVQILLKDPRVDPTDFNYHAIRIAIDEGNPMVLSMLMWNQNTIDNLEENTVRKWRDSITYNTPVYDILTRFIDRAHRSELPGDAERYHKRLKDPIVT